MNGPDLIRIVDLMHRDKNIPKEVIFEGIEAALQLATQKHYGTEEEIAISIDRDSGEIKAQRKTTGTQLNSPRIEMLCKRAAVGKLHEKLVLFKGDRPRLPRIASSLAKAFRCCRTSSPTPAA